MSENNITWATVQMLAGLKVTRTGWGEHGFLTVPRRGMQYIFLTRLDGTASIWVPLPNDFLVSDWVLYVETPE